MTSHAAATIKRRKAPAQIARSGLGRLSASQPTIAAQIAAITAAAAGSAITGRQTRRNLQSCWRVYRRDRGGDDARLLQEWVLSWGDLFEAEIVPVVSSAETREVVSPFL